MSDVCNQHTNDAVLDYPIRVSQQGSINHRKVYGLHTEAHKHFRRRLAEAYKLPILELGWYRMSMSYIIDHKQQHTCGSVSQLETASQA